jgi:hypothetical protein
MKQNAFKKLIKESVREVIQEELKEILVEAIKSPKQTIVESPSFTSPINENSTISSRDRRAEYQNIMGDMRSSFNTSHAEKPLQLRGSMDTVSEGASLPDGNVSMDQIMGLMNKG